MSDSDSTAKKTTDTEPAAEAPSTAIAPEGERLEGVDDIEFLLEEIENKIAPLALA